MMIKAEIPKKSHRAFLWFLYYTGCRVSEILCLVKKQFRETPDQLAVHVPALKMGTPRGEYFLEKTADNVLLICEVVNKTRGKRKVFNFSRSTAWGLVKRLDEKLYPHFFRLNRCVQFLNAHDEATGNPKYSEDEVRQWFAWKSINTIDHYRGYSPRTTQRLSKGLK